MKKIIVETLRVIIRKYELSDLDDLYEYLSDAKVVEYEPYKPLTRDETLENLKWRVQSDEMFAVELKENHKMIGNIYLGKRDFETLEIGYVFNRKYWGQGLAKEATEMIIKHMFEKGIHRIYAECDPSNIASWKLLEKLGFVREGHLLKNVYFWKDDNGNPIWKDTFIYSILNK